jgi:hypothetical protein
MSRHKEVEKVIEAINVVQTAGGVEIVQEKLKRYDDAYGLPPCETDERDGKRSPRAIALIRLEDTYLEIERGSPDFDKVLRELRTKLEAVKRLSVPEFRQHFGALRQLQPNCRHFVDIRVATQFLAPMDSLQSGFRIATRR